MRQIPVYTPSFTGNELAYVTECIRSGWISAEGPFTGRFEDAFARSVSRAHGISVCNGTAALELALRSAGVGAGDEVIVPAFSIVSCTAAVLRCGATPVLVDSDARTWNMHPELVAERLTARTKAVLAVHTYGLPADIEALASLAASRGMVLLEDAAEAHGARAFGQPCGSFGTLSVFSFYANKAITTGEGGMVLTNDPLLAERCRSFRNLCFGDRHRFRHEELGNNFRMSALSAAVGLAQLEKLEEVTRLKRRNASLYRQRLSALDVLELPLERTSFAENVYWVFGVVLKEGAPRPVEDVRKRLSTAGVATRQFFWPMHEQPVFQKMGLFGDEQYPVAESLARRGFYLPMGLDLTEEDIDFVCNALSEAIS